MSHSDAKERVRQASQRCASTDKAAIAEEEKHGKPDAPLGFSMVPIRQTKVQPLYRSTWTSMNSWSKDSRDKIVYKWNSHVIGIFIKAALVTHMKVHVVSGTQIYMGRQTSQAVAL